MSVKNLGLGKEASQETLLGRIRLSYVNAQKLLDASKTTISTMVGGTEASVPKLNVAINDALQAAREFLDEINRVLADRAIPDFRKATITARRIEERSYALAPVASADRVVRASATKLSEKAKNAPKDSASNRSKDAQESKRQNSVSAKGRLATNASGSGSSKVKRVASRKKAATQPA